VRKALVFREFPRSFDPDILVEQPGGDLHTRGPSVSRVGQLELFRTVAPQARPSGCVERTADDHESP